MDFQQTINHAKDLLRNSIGETLEFIVPHLNPESEVFDDLVLVEGRNNEIEREFSKGLINSPDRNLGLNHIRNSILNILNNLADTDLRIDSQSEGITDNSNSLTLLEKLRDSIAQVEKLKSENRALQDQEKNYKLKIIIQCEPEIDDRPNNYTCQCIILNDETGESNEREIPLRREPGGIVATIHNIEPSNYVQIRIKDNDKEWESEYFSPQFLTQVLRLV